MPKPRRQPGVPGRGTLTKAAVIELAARLADDVGSVERLQLADLAQKLGIRTPSLYAHVDSLASLRRSIAIAGLAEVEQRIHVAVSGLSGNAALLAFAREIRAYALERPGVFAATALPPADAEWERAQKALREILVLILSRNGMSEDVLTDCIRALRAAMHGFIVLEMQGDFGQPDPAASFDRLMTVVIRGMLAEGRRSMLRSRGASVVRRPTARRK